MYIICVYKYKPIYINMNICVLRYIPICMRGSVAKYRSAVLSAAVQWSGNEVAERKMMNFGDLMMYIGNRIRSAQGLSSHIFLYKTQINIMGSVYFICIGSNIINVGFSKYKNSSQQFLCCIRTIQRKLYHIINSYNIFNI